MKYLVAILTLLAAPAVASACEPLVVCSSPFVGSGVTFQTFHAAPTVTLAAPATLYTAQTFVPLSIDVYSAPVVIQGVRVKSVGYCRGGVVNAFGNLVPRRADVKIKVKQKFRR